MQRPEDMFDIIQEERVHTREDGSTWTTRSYCLIYKPTGEKHFPKSRQYGYSHLVQAKIARTKLFNSYMKEMEKSLLG